MRRGIPFPHPRTFPLRSFDSRLSWRYFLPASSFPTRTTLLFPAAASSSCSQLPSVVRFPPAPWTSPMESPSRSSPIAFSGGPLSSADDASLVPDPHTQPGSAAGSFQGAGDGVLTAPASSVSAVSPAGDDAEFGFQRAEMGKNPLAGTVQFYERHVFLCYKSPTAWPTHVEGAESDRLPRLLAAEIKNCQRSMTKKTRLTICEGEDGTDSSNGDILIFPDMARYRRLTHFDVQNFVEEVLIQNTEWRASEAQKLSGSYVFVCAHGSRDRRCGVCGPVLIDKFKEEIGSHGLQGQVSVSGCSHIGGHKYAGNVIIFSSNSTGEVTGHWYGYVTPDDVSLLLQQHIGKGKIIDHLWRGQMGLSEEQQKAIQKQRLQLNGQSDSTLQETLDSSINETIPSAVGCCQGSNVTACCQAMPKTEIVEDLTAREQDSQDVIKSNNKDYKGSSNKGSNTRKISPLPSWFGSWEREDTYAAIAVVAAIASVAVAYTCYRQIR